MGYYYGQRENPCPRCGGVVSTVFISIPPMKYFQLCNGCKTEVFTKEEEKLLGGNEPALVVGVAESEQASV